MPSGVYTHKPHSEETKRKLSNLKKGKPFSGVSFDWTGKKHTEEHNRKIGLKSIGRKHTEETKLKIKEAHLGEKNAMFGKYASEHHLWKKDRNQVVKSEKKHLDGRYKEWMLAVKRIDNWKCKISNKDCCGRLEAHHILNWKDYPELRYDINNGITLCHAHHPRGRTREAELSPYLQSLVAERK